MNEQLPKDWKWVKLEEVCEKIVDGSHNPPRSIDSGKPMLSAKDIFNNKINFDNPRWVSEEEFQRENRRTEIKAGDVLLTIVATIGRTAVVPIKAPKFTLQRSVAVLKTIQNPYFFCYAFQTPKFQQQLRDYSKGTAQKGVYLKTLAQLEIPLPPLTTQQAIVAKIEELFSELDKGIENLRTAQQQLKTYRQSVLKWAFEGKLTNEHVQEGELPKGWKWVSIEEVATVGTGATPLKSNSSFYGGNIPWVTSGALNDEFVIEATDFVTEKAIKETNLTLYPKHTLLVAMYGEGKTRGKCSELLIEACTNQAIAAIYFDNHDSSIKPYLKYFLLKNYNDVRKQSSGGVQPNLNLGIIKKLVFPLPPLKEQHQIVQAIESRLSVADKMEESITQSLQQSEALRQSILKKAFEGRLV